jgi:hypothetical protein
MGSGIIAFLQRWRRPLAAFMRYDDAFDTSGSKPAAERGVIRVAQLLITELLDT